MSFSGQYLVNFSLETLNYVQLRTLLTEIIEIYPNSLFLSHVLWYVNFIKYL